MIEPMLHAGEYAPDFCLPRDEFNRVCLRDVLARGRHAVLVFYVLDFTSV